MWRSLKDHVEGTEDSHRIEQRKEESRLVVTAAFLSVTKVRTTPEKKTILTTSTLVSSPELGYTTSGGLKPRLGLNDPAELSHLRLALCETSNPGWKGHNLHLPRVPTSLDHDSKAATKL